MNISVIAVVVTFNRIKFLPEVIDALKRQTYRLDKILIIDNNSSDGTNEYCMNEVLSHDNILYFNTGSNLGGAGGFNYGVGIAQEFDFDRLWLMDDDLVPDEYCLENMLRNDLGDIIQPLRVNLDGSCAEISPVTYDLAAPFVVNPKRLTVVSLLSYIQGDISHAAVALDGIPFEGPLIKKKVIDAIGLPNKNYFIFYDDLDFAIRARKAGYTIFCDFNAKATRLLRNNQGQDLNSWKGYFMLRNMFHISWVYGENIFVRYRPFIITIAYILVSLPKANFKQIKVAIKAYIDSFRLSNTDKNKP